MRVLVVNTNRERSPYTLIPSGACRVASAASDAGHEVNFCDLGFCRDPIKTVSFAVERFKPDITGFSIRNIDNCDFLNPRFYLPGIRRIVDACRKAGAGTLVIGGPAVSSMPEQTMKYLEADYAVVGEGEKAFPALISALKTNSDPAAVPGVGTIRDNHLTITPPAPVKDLKSVTDYLPDRWIGLNSYLHCDASYAVQTKRGCGFNCSYCLYPAIEGSTIRTRDPDQVAGDVEKAAKLGFRSVEFVDSVFNVPESHAVACCESIARLKSRISLHTVDFNPSACSDDLVCAMRAAGFGSVGCTAESACDAMLVSLNKGFTSDDLRRTAGMLGMLNVPRMWIFLLGGPGENERTVMETGRFMAESLSSKDLVYVTCGIRILPGTHLHRSVIDEQVISPDDDLLEPRFYFSPHITPARAVELLFKSGFPASNILTASDGNNRLLPLAQSAARHLGIPPPYWRLAPYWNMARRFLPVKRGCRL